MEIANRETSFDSSENIAMNDSEKTETNGKNNLTTMCFRKESGKAWRLRKWSITSPKIL